MTDGSRPDSVGSEPVRLDQARLGSEPARLDVLRHRIRLASVVALLAAGTLLVDPGRIQPDTKLDLVVSPWRYLARALSVWNTHTGIGEVQNQAYGYLFPMGPFFGVVQWLEVPAWVTQRLWWALLLGLAFLGAERLARRLGVRAPWSIASGLTYALAPRVLTLLAEVSAEAWPLAILPWLALVAWTATGPEADNPRGRWRLLVRTGALAACLGGVNATASLVALVPAALIILTAPRRTHRPRNLLCWALGALAGAAWWLGPLLVLGGYAYPFLDFIESASTTTAVASFPNVLRGTDHWVAYILTSGDHPIWQSGWVLAQSVVAIVATCALAGVGIAGLLSRARHTHDLPSGDARDVHGVRFLLVSLVLGIVVLTIGRQGTASSLLAPEVHRLLDGPLAALRNVHKADPLVRLPVAVGLGFLIQGRAAVGWWVIAPPRRLADRVALVAVLVAALGSVQPVWEGRVGDAWSWERLPAAWRQTAALVDASAARIGGTTLLLPASRFADAAWGNTRDEPLSALASSPVLVRASAPLGPPGATRLLDEIDRLAASGVRQDALASTLARMGVSRVVLRRDLAASADARPWQSVERTLALSPGFTPVADVGEGSGRLSVVQVTSAVRPAPVAYAAHPAFVPTPPTLAAGPEAIPGLLAAGVLGVGDSGAVDPPTGGIVATDTLRLRSFNAGRPAEHAHGATTERGDPAVGPLAPPDLPPAGPGVDQPVLVVPGVQHLAVTSTRADPFDEGAMGPAGGPGAALDGDPETAWWPSAEDALPRLDLTWSTAGPISSVSVRLVGARVGAEVRLLVPEPVLGRVDATGSADFSVPAGSRGGLSLTIPRGSGLAEVTVDGRGLQAAIAVPVGAARTVLLARDAEDSALVWRRLLRAVGSGGSTPSWAVRAWLRPRTGPDLDRLLDGPLTVSGSSRQDADPAHRPGAALDGRSDTGWVPARQDSAPTLTLDIPATGLPVTTITLGPAASGASAALVIPGGQRFPLTSGSRTVPDLRGSRITVQFFGLTPGAPTPKIRLDGLAPGPTSLTATCSEGATLTVDGRSRGLAATWTLDDVLAGAAVPARVCAPSEAARPGAQSGPDDSLLVATSGRGVVDAVRLDLPVTGDPSATGAAPPARGLRTATSTATERHLRVDPGGPAVLTLLDGANPGWVATLADGTPLRPVTVDGWRQGFDLPAATTPLSVTVRFTPQTRYAASLAIGAALAFALILLSLLGSGPGRRRFQGEVSSTALRAALTRTGPVPTGPVHTGPEPTGPEPPPHVLGVLGVLGAAAVLATGLGLAGPVGAFSAAAALLLPRRWRARAAVVALVVTGVAVAALGVADRFSAAAWVGQCLGCFVLGLLLATLLAWRGGPSAGPGPRAATTTGSQATWS